MSDVRDLIIVGSGPSGYTAAIYAARAALRPLVFEGAVTAGGALMNTTEVENFPGFPQGIMGPELMDNLRGQAERFGAELEKRLSGHGVSWCATCDGFFFRGQDIAVVGGGDSAIEEALFLTKFAETVTIIHRRDELRASRIMAERALANPKLRFAWNSTVTAIHGADKVSSVTLADVGTGEERELAVTGLFIAIGHDPRSELITDQVQTDEAGYVMVEGRTTQVLSGGTVLPGVFAAGDLVDHTYRQAITAAGTGCAAALDAERFLAVREHALSAAV
jgi:thioredoxin reductase (NADPH)